ERAHSLDVAGERALHVRAPEAVDPAVAHEPLRLEARDPGEPRLAARVRGIHVPVEHQARAAAGTLPEPDDVRPPVLHLLPLHLETHPLELLAHALPHRLLVAGWARDRHEVDGEGDEAALVDARRDVRRGNAAAPPDRRARSGRAGGHPRARASR